MKNLHILFIGIIILCSFNACQKDIVFVEGSGPGSSVPPTALISLSAKVNGTLVTCDVVTATADASTNSLIVAGTKNSEIFQFVFQNFAGVGDYNAADFFSSASYVNGTDPLTQIFFADSGNIKISSYNSTTIKGTFDFVATNAVGDVKTITEGKFTSKIIKN